MDARPYTIWFYTKCSTLCWGKVHFWQIAREIRAPLRFSLANYVEVFQARSGIEEDDSIFFGNDAGCLLGD